MTETGRFYSSIRRIPTTLYRLPDGTRVRMVGLREAPTAVSYTHLTLPTILLV